MQLPDRFIYYRLVSKPDSPKADKIPCNAAGDSINPHDPSQWMTRAVADAGRTNAVSGIGFVLNGDGWWCVDLDNCGPDWNAAAVAIYQSFTGAMAEVSVSGTGLHIFGRCDPSRLADRRNKWDGWCEWYHTGRFIALGPHGLQPIGPEFIDRDWTDQLLRLVPKRADTSGVLAEGIDPAYTGPDDDDKLITIMLRSTSNAARFGGAATVSDLWNANAEVLSRIYPAFDGGNGFDRSAADAALMSHLAFWTGKDLPRMDRLFRRSALMRDKYVQREDYRRDTIHGAARMCKKVYDAPRREMPLPVTAAAPVAGGRETFLTVPEMIEYFKGCVYILDVHKVLVPGGRLLKPEQFNAWYGGHMFQMLPDGTKPSKKAFDALTECMAHTFPRAETSVFRPDLPTGTITPEGAVNIYVPPDVQTRPGDVSRFTDFLERLLPAKRDREILISWCAAVVQHVGVKFQWAPVLQGAEGNGKSLIASVLVYALGEDYAYEPRASQLGSQFISFDENRLLIVCEEIHMNGRRELLDDLKPRITNRRVEVEAKGQDKRMIVNTANWFFCTNYRDAVLKSRNDRRYAVFFTAQQSVEDIARDGMGGGYFPALYTWLRGGGYANVAHWLATYPIPDDLNPATACHRAPITSSTDAAVSASAGAIESEIQEAIESESLGFRGGWISSHMLDRMLRERGSKIARSRLGSILAELGYTQWGRSPRPIMMEDAKRPVLWCKGTPAQGYVESQRPGYQ